MALFSRTPEKTAIKDRDAAKVNVDRLAGKLVEAEVAVIATKQAAQAAALAGDDDALDVAETAEAGALRRLNTFRAAYAESETLLATLEAQIIVTADSKLRAGTNARIEELATKFTEVFAALDVAIGAAVDVTSEAKIVSGEFAGMLGFVMPAQTEIAGAVPFLANILKECGARVLNHEAPAAYPTPEPAFVPEIVAKPETRHLFTLRGITWKEGDQVRVAGKFRDIDLPVAYVKRALRTNACCEIGSPLRNPSTINQWPGTPDPANCFSLDGDEPVTDAIEERALVTHSAFEIVDRGRPYLARVQGGAL